MITLLALCAAAALGTLPADPVYPGAAWASKPPAAVGLDPAGLAAFREAVGGRGCVVRHGVMAYTWGDPKKRGDVASAVKPVFGHFLLKAVEEGRLDTLDTPVARVEKRLESLNPDLDHKDRRITFRHMIFQTSCYGVTEPPGTAFDYNDWQMALFADTLFNTVYATPWERVDAEVAGPRLFARIGCEDRPHFTTEAEDRHFGRLTISVRDFARFGLLYLHDGQWEGRPVLAREVARRAVSSPLPGPFPRTKARPAALIPGQRSLGSMKLPDDQTDHYGSYSFAWWTNGIDRDGQRNWPGAPLDAFAALGHGGRRGVVVVPSLDLVTSWNDSRIDDRAKQGEALARLVRAVTGP
jgi:CubicO group peptidase (beta-lactamase class C family)